jgi:hypothetical protein
MTSASGHRRQVKGASKTATFPNGEARRRVLLAQVIMIQFSDQEIADERLVLDSAAELYYLGHNLTLKSCTLVIKVPARLVGNDFGGWPEAPGEASIEDCDFRRRTCTSAGSSRVTPKRFASRPGHASPSLIQ